MRYAKFAKQCNGLGITTCLEFAAKSRWQSDDAWVIYTEGRAKVQLGRGRTKRRAVAKAQTKLLHVQKNAVREAFLATFDRDYVQPALALAREQVQWEASVIERQARAAAAAAANATASGTDTGSDP